MPAIRLVPRELLDVLPLCTIADDSVPSSLHLAVATGSAADGRPHDLCPSRCLVDAFEHPTHGGIRGEVMGVGSFWLIGGAADESWLANAVPVFIDGAKRSAIPRLVSATADGQFSTTGRRHCATTRFNRQITRRCCIAPRFGCCAIASRIARPAILWSRCSPIAEITVPVGPFSGVASSVSSGVASVF